VGTRARISDTRKLHIANIYKVWRAVESSLEDNQSAGSYRLKVVTECKSPLGEAGKGDPEYRVR